MISVTVMFKRRLELAISRLNGLYGIIVLFLKKGRKKKRKQVTFFIFHHSLIRFISVMFQDIKIA